MEYIYTYKKVMIYRGVQAVPTSDWAGPAMREKLESAPTAESTCGADLLQGLQDAVLAL